MLSRWIQENSRFLYIVGGAALLLLIFQWMFVWKPRNDYARSVRTYGKTWKKLDGLRKLEDPPIVAQLRRRETERKLVEAALNEGLRVFGGRPQAPFKLPPGDPAAAPNYYFEQQNKVIEEVRQAAIDGAVNLADEQLGLPQSLPKGSDNARVVSEWLWNLQVVRRAMLAAIVAGVDVVEKVSEVGGEPRNIIEGDGELYGQPQEFEVAGPTDAVVRWLESIQREGNYIVMLACRIKRDSSQLGVVSCRALLMGVDRRATKKGDDE